ncbi:MAG: NAD(P)-dependent alcohol dehydrogenase [Thermoanaerobaculia bacterium]|nr:NAD(P)-dependent alcohol dehydrogenase [Thermoanaerobaculia bacterium]
MIPSEGWQIGPGFGIDSLRLKACEIPEPGPGDVTVALEAFSLNYRDLLMVEGRYNPRQPLPLVPGSDAVGRVVAAGEGTHRVAVGDLVAPTFAQDWVAGDPTHSTYGSTLGGPLDGTLRRHVSLSQEGVVRIPEGWTPLAAATLPCAAVTAWNALFELGSVQAGDTVLVLGTGGVSLFALQFAHRVGARVLVTSSRSEKLDRAQDLGASGGVDYRSEPEWGRAIRDLAEGRGVDHVVEVGGAATLAQSLRAVRPGGTISLIGNLGGDEASFSVIPILMRQIRVQGVFVGPRLAFENLLKSCAEDPLEPVIDQVFDFGELPRALEYLGRGDHFGKVCVQV